MIGKIMVPCNRIDRNIMNKNTRTQADGASMQHPQQIQVNSTIDADIGKIWLDQRSCCTSIADTEILHTLPLLYSPPKSLTTSDRRQGCNSCSQEQDRQE